MRSALLALLAACEIHGPAVVDIYPDADPPAPMSDAGVDAAPVPPVDGTLADGAVAPPGCPQIAASPPSGHHAANGVPGDPGATVITQHEGCMGQSGCHDPTKSPAPGLAFSYGGEAYAGVTPAAGAWIMLGNGSATAMLEIATNGFFWSQSFPQPTTAVQVSAFMCGVTTEPEMQATLKSASDGSCDGCHGGGSAGFVSAQ